MIRMLHASDYEQYLNLLKQLTDVGKVNKELFLARYLDISRNKNHKIFVKIKENEIVGAITCFVEPKFIHQCSDVCHIEDFVVDRDHRKLGHGRELMDHAKQYAKTKQCYKITLDCDEKCVPVYKKLDFSQNNFQMEIRDF